MRLESGEVFAPLHGKVVADFSTLFPGPYAGLLLAQLGCRVVKVEPPSGDPGRTMNPGGFALMNAGKESIALDVKHPRAAPVVEGLVRRADAVLVSSLPGTLARLGLEARSVQRHNPRAIYCHVLGWSGPLRDLPAHDLDTFAGAGAIALAPGAGYPLGLPVADLAAGALAALQVAAALAARSEPGPVLEVSMASVLQSWVALGAGAASRADLERAPDGPPRVGGYGIFTAADGRSLSVGAVEDRFWRSVVDVCELPPGLAAIVLEDRRGRADELNAALAGRLRTAPAATWVERLRAAGVPAAPVATLAEAFTPAAGGDAVHVLDSGRIGLSLPSGTPATAFPAAPGLGEHTDPILRELGLAGHVDELRADGVVV
jgi:crotonobetainyl-CoA:carnitine CoA-transferase CaiB-like acyl-CoA transferase